MHAAITTVLCALTACAVEATSDPGRDPDRAGPLAPAPTPAPAARPPADTVASFSFEPASADCNGWNATGATSIRSVPSHSGAYACKLCADGSSEEMALSQRIGGLDAGRYVARAWVRRHGEGDVPLAARLSLEMPSPSVGIRASVPLGDEWRALDDPVELRAAALSATVTVAAIGAARGDCVLVDDVSVRRGD